MPDPSQTPPLISARGLTKRFGTFTAVDGIDFDVAPGGEGKETIVPMINTYRVIFVYPPSYPWPSPS
ncbi:MAG: hypothetical protein A2V85_07835 [Chloroflexi bacterium RBG_16_72_14]|nr:MAG: hypothetical protein A2V85_07835 [Chloroflexi bacterium RBG_16_72_14]